MSIRPNRWAVGGVVACLFGLTVAGTASAQPSTAALCSDVTHLAQADAAALDHPTEQNVHRLAVDLKATSAAIPPVTVVANRAQLEALIATNILGHNAPAMAATEAQYGEMWAQDAAALFGYSASPSTASVEAKLAPVATYVEHTCQGSMQALKELDASDHHHPMAGPRP